MLRIFLKAALIVQKNHLAKIKYWLKKITFDDRFNRRVLLNFFIINPVITITDIFHPRVIIFEWVFSCENVMQNDSQTPNIMFIISCQITSLPTDQFRRHETFCSRILWNGAGLSWVKWFFENRDSEICDSRFSSDYQNILRFQVSMYNRSLIPKQNKCKIPNSEF